MTDDYDREREALALVERLGVHPGSRLDIEEVLARAEAHGRSQVEQAMTDAETRLTQHLARRRDDPSHD